MTTLHVRGTGGAEFDADVPAEGLALELFLGQITRGDLTVLNDEGDPLTSDELADVLSAPSAAEPATGEKSGEADSAASSYPEGKSIDAVLGWVGADHERAAEALAKEQAKGAKARSTLVEHLTRLPHDVPHEPADSATPNDQTPEA